MATVCTLVAQVVLTLRLGTFSVLRLDLILRIVL